MIENTGYPSGSETATVSIAIWQQGQRVSYLTQCKRRPRRAGVLLYSPQNRCSLLKLPLVV
jgi:hypothetical protein